MSCVARIPLLYATTPHHSTGEPSLRMTEDHHHNHHHHHHHRQLQEQQKQLQQRPPQYRCTNNHNNHHHEQHHCCRRDSHDKLSSFASHSDDDRRHYVKREAQEDEEEEGDGASVKRSETGAENQQLVDPSDGEELNVSSVEVLYGKTRHTIVIDDNLTANGFCQVLKLKLNLSQAENWSLVLKIPKENIQRLLEDDEEVLPIYNRYKVFLCYLTIEKNLFLQKYDFFEHPSMYFAPEMITFPGGTEDHEDINKQVTLNRIASQLHAFEKFRVILSGPLSLMDKNGESLPRWKNMMATLDTSEESECNSNYGQRLVCNDVQSKAHKTFDVRKSCIFYYNDLPAKSSPEFRFCLVEEESGKFTWFGTKSQLQYQCWLTVLRLVKYGLKELSDCYRFWKRNSGNKLPLSSIGSSSSSFSHSANTYLDMGQGKAIIDYTHKDGPRVIEDPKEILSLVDEESNQWRKRLDSDSSRSRSYSSSLCSSPGTLTPKSSSSSPTKYHHHHHQIASRWTMAPATAITTTTTTSNYLSHPWFYDDMNREEAQKLLEKYEKIDGVFLVRTSPRNPDGFVLSFVVRGKIKHVQINQIDVDHQVCWTLDLGKTKFYDIQQLIEFYQLNHTVLGTRLTHFLVHKTTHHTP